MSAPGSPLFSSQDQVAGWSAALPEGAFARAGLSYFHETASTQDEAFDAAARGAPHGAVFLAERQSAGRGRRGATWVAPEGSSLLLSALLSPAPAAERSGRTALAAAVAAARAIETVLPSAAVEIKWPNDLLLEGRKLGGVLVETRGGCAALGLGINVSQRPEDFPPDIRDRSTSLLAGTVRRDPRLADPGIPIPAPSRQPLLSALLAELGRVLPTSDVSDGRWADLRAEVERRLAWRGRAVRIRGCPRGPLVGKLVGLDSEGKLLLDVDDRRAIVAGGSVELLSC